MDRNKILKMTVVLAAIVVIAGSLSRLFSRNSMSLTQYAELNGVAESASNDSEDESNDSKGESDSTDESDAGASSSESGSQDAEAEPDASLASTESSGSAADSGSTESSEESGIPTDPSWEYVGTSSLIGASLNGSSQLEERTVLAEGFYYEPISDNLRRYMTGISYPAADSFEEGAQPEISFDDLRYLHILHVDFEGETAEGELICNELIVQDLAEIFQELYRNEYRIEKVLLIDEYEGDDTASMADNNTSCFNYRPIAGSERLSKHAYGLAVDINPLYNPYITYGEDGERQISPASALPYADRSADFPYKIDEEDLCYKLFTKYGFTWGGNWNSMKDYQHFQKAAKS